LKFVPIWSADPNSRSGQDSPSALIVSIVVVVVVAAAAAAAVWWLV